MTWLLLVYTVPSKPSRLRAAVWRDLKKAGAVYLRDGVAVLPEGAETRAIFQAIVTRIDGFGGQATLIEGGRLDIARAEEVIAQARSNRVEEYAEIAREAEQLLAHAERERTHREFTFAELEEIEENLGKLRRWTAQVRARDHFGAPAVTDLEDLLGRCERATSAFLEQAHRRSERGAS